MGSGFLLMFSETTRMSSCSMTSSMDSSCSYGPVKTLSWSSRKVMHSFRSPWIFWIRSRSASDVYRFLTDISKLSRRWVGSEESTAMRFRAFSTCSFMTRSSIAITRTS